MEISIESTSEVLPTSFTEANITKKRGKAKNYILATTFDCFKEAQNEIKNGFGGQKWIIHNRTESFDGNKIWYRCQFNDF